MAPEYVLVFDYLEMPLDPAPWKSGIWAFVVGPILFVAGVIRKRVPDMALGLFFVVFASVWTGTAYSSSQSAYNRLERLKADGLYRTFEGVVEDYESIPERAPKEERFRVGDRSFGYHGYEWTPGFNRMAVRGGPIRPGMRVRISTLGDTIVRLEIAAADMPATL